MQSEVNSMYSRFSIAISSRSGRAGSRERSGLPAPCSHLGTVWLLKCMESASSFWVSPFSFRKDAIIRPIFLHICDYSFRSSLSQDNRAADICNKAPWSLPEDYFGTCFFSSIAARAAFSCFFLYFIVSMSSRGTRIPCICGSKNG